VKQINEITNEPRQQHLLPIDGGVFATLTLEFRPDLYAWFFALQWGDFATANEQMVACPNVLRQYSQILPFGIFCDTTTLQDPMTQDAFTQGAAVLYLLDAAEVVEMETRMYG
jgi:hypothetical protein